MYIYICMYFKLYSLFVYHWSISCVYRLHIRLIFSLSHSAHDCSFLFILFLPQLSISLYSKKKKLSISHSTSPHPFLSAHLQLILFSLSPHVLHFLPFPLSLSLNPKPISTIRTRISNCKTTFSFFPLCLTSRTPLVH